MSISKKLYGKMNNGCELYDYTIDNSNGFGVSFLNYGGIVTKILVPDKNGVLQDVVLGRSSLEEYLNNDGYIGAAIGRYANRLEKGEFVINGVSYKAGINENGNSLHGGINGFDKKIWAAAEDHENNSICLSCISHDGEEGFPGELCVNMIYTVKEDNTFNITYKAISDKDTICNLTNHSYFNLGGHESGNIYGHILQLNADFYTPNNSECMPTGEILSVSGTPFDFRAPKPIGQDIKSNFEQIEMFGGYDHNFVINGSGFRKAASVKNLDTGITMNVYTNQPGMQFYTANALAGGVKKNEKEYGIHDAFCMETQSFPNAMKNSHFPGPFLAKNKMYSHITEYQFITEK